jgi:hypothetical protein
MQFTAANAPALLNLFAALWALFFLGWGVLRLAEKYPQGEFRFLFRALCTWWLSWLAWVVLWACLAVGYRSTPLVSILSNLNTVLLILTYFGLTHGKDYSVAHYVITGVQALLVVGFIDLGFYLFGLLPGQALVVNHLQTNWSIALSVIGPLLFGWACSLRFGTTAALIVGLMYAALQPFAYEAVREEASKVTWVVAALAILALLKVAYAAAGLACFGVLPQTAANLVQPAAALPETNQNWGAWPALILGIGGAATVWVVAKVCDLELAQSITAYLAGFAILLGGLLRLLETLGNLAKRWAGIVQP